jgi:predicted metal-dependent phosphoesterase TrpH
LKKIDLHCHSTFSDGDYTPPQLLEMARTKGISLFSLTDHDTVYGLSAAAAAAGEAGVSFIPGTEISIEHATGTFHLLGYGFDVRDPRLLRMLSENQDSREKRCQEWIRQMQAHGMDVTIQDLKTLAGGDLHTATKLHAAHLLLIKGVVPTKDDAFAEGGPLSPTGWLNVERRHATAAQGITALRQAGGRSLVAHPYTLGFDTYDHLQEYLSGLKELGLDGIEVYHSDHTPEQVRAYLHIARELDFVVSGGSDFHGRVMPGVEMLTGRGDLDIRIEGIVRAREVK